MEIMFLNFKTTFCLRIYIYMLSTKTSHQPAFLFSFNFAARHQNIVYSFTHSYASLFQVCVYLTPPEHQGAQRGTT